MNDVPPSGDGRYAEGSHASTSSGRAIARPMSSAATANSAVLSAQIARRTTDPIRNPKAERYSRLSYDKVLTDRLGVMDATAIVMCRDNGLPLRVFNLFNAGDLIRIVDGEDVGTLVVNGV